MLMGCRSFNSEGHQWKANIDIETIYTFKLPPAIECLRVVVHILEGVKGEAEGLATIV